MVMESNNMNTESVSMCKKKMKRERKRSTARLLHLKQEEPSRHLLQAPRRPLQEGHQSLPPHWQLSHYLGLLPLRPPLLLLHLPPLPLLAPRLSRFLPSRRHFHVVPRGREAGRRGRKVEAAVVGGIDGREEAAAGGPPPRSCEVGEIGEEEGRLPKRWHQEYSGGTRVFVPAAVVEVQVVSATSKDKILVRPQPRVGRGSLLVKPPSPRMGWCKNVRFRGR